MAAPAPTKINNTPTNAAAMIGKILKRIDSSRFQRALPAVTATAGERKNSAGNNPRSPRRASLKGCADAG
jgi:hypothetical protein